jgi:phospholipid/cholesterol/gamma-HCH transport system ATP-binding protein
MSATPLILLENVRLAFGEKPVLEDVSIRAHEKERLVVMGQSGSGKSSLLRLLLGILSPDGGSIKIHGRDLARVSRRQLNRIRRRVGMVYQYSALIGSLTVAENLALPLQELTSKTRDEINESIDEKLALVGMSDVREKMPAELSGGMRKRVGLARGIILDPEIILYDEPTAGLDPVISSVIDELMITLSTKIGATSIIVTHDMGSAFKVATRMAMLYEGKIHAEGTPEEIKRDQNPVVAQFISGNTEGPISHEN